MTNIIEKLIELYKISHEENNITTRYLIHDIIIDIVSKDSITVEQGSTIFDRLDKIRTKSITKIKATI